jgi:hypothetical protein
MKVDMEQDDVFGKCIEATGRRAWGMEHGASGMEHGAFRYFSYEVTGDEWHPVGGCVFFDINAELE